MREQLIDFDTAKLAKERGFLEPCFHYFSLEGGEKKFMEDGLYFPSKGENGRLILRPTQTQLQKWLREKYGIDILVQRSFSNGIKRYILTPCFDKPILKGYQSIEKNNYEEALEIALFKSLKYII